MVLSPRDLATREAADPDRAREAANYLSSQSIQERLRENIHVISSLALWNSAKWLAASQSAKWLAPQLQFQQDGVGCDREKKAATDLVTREYTANLNKRLHGIAFKKRVPRAVHEPRKFAEQTMKAKDVRLDTKLNKYLWSKGKVPK